MSSVRNFLRQNPMLGWVLASLLMIAGAFGLYLRLGQKSETDQLTEIVTIRCSETGETWELPRGVMEKELYMRPYPLDPNQGLTNPHTGKPTGFPVDAWKETTARINADRKALADAQDKPSGK